jgi:hypothetical protein
VKPFQLAWLVVFPSACATTSEAPLRERAGDAAPAFVASAQAVSQDAQGAGPIDQLRVLSVHVGMRQFDEDDWAPVEDQTSFALDYAMQWESAPVGFEAGLSYSSEDDDVFVPTIGTVDFDTEFVEVYAGVHKSFAVSSVRPALGAGITVISADAEASSAGASASDDDQTFGFYVHGGIGVPLGDTFEIGADLRAVIGAELEIAGVDVDADYTQASLVLAWRI